MKEKWMIKNKNRDKITTLSTELGISKVLSTLLVNRDILDFDQAKMFLKSNTEDLLDGFSMKDMRKGVAKIKESIEQGKKIVIYGDYDCDGVISTVILHKGLKRCNAIFDYHIPNREEEGYGMNKGRIEKLKEQGFQVILTCDNGISAVEEVKFANELGMEVVLTDHHDIPFKENEHGIKEATLPEAYAVINPKQEDCSYGFKSLCGAGVALKFIECLYEEMGIPREEALTLVEYCAIATVCDVVDLNFENRIIVKKGLKKINNTNNLGLKALIKHTNLQDKEIGAYHLGFVIGPCINATGRLETAALSVDLFLEENEEKADCLAKELFELNQRRQELTKDSVDMVNEQIERECMENDKVMVVYNPYIHESIAGIVAGRVRERYNVPSIVLTKGKDMPKGSGRSIDEYNMFEELSKCKELLSKFGGHPMAAGMSLEECNLSVFRKMLLEKCSLTDNDIIPKIKIDMQLPINYLNEELVNSLKIMEPFGKANPSPLFGEKAIEVSRIWTMGKEKNILKLRCKIPNSYKTIDAISFDKFEDFKFQFAEKYGENKLLEILDSSFCNFKVDLIYYPSINEYNGNRNIQLIIKNIRI